MEVSTKTVTASSSNQKTLAMAHLGNVLINLKKIGAEDLFQELKPFMTRIEREVAQ